MSTDRPTPEPTIVQTEDERRRAAREYVQQRRALHLHAIVFAGSMVLILGVNAVVNLAAGLTGEWSAWWSGWALAGWGIGLATHAFVVRLARPEGPGSAWEDRQVDELLSPETA